MECKHLKTVLQSEADIDWDTGEEVSRLVTVEVATYEDIDTHRYKCTQCEKIMYYSSRAREFYENGVECEMYGLTLVDVLKKT